MTTMIEKVAKAIYETRNGKGCTPWAKRGMAHKAPYFADARAAIGAMGDPTEKQLDAVRYIIQWHTFERPTEAALLRHAGCLRKEPPEGCRDVEHVPPTNMVSYWVHKGIIDAALSEEKAE